MTTDISQRYTVKQFVAKYPFLTEAGIRWQLFQSKANGMDDYCVIERIGRRVLLHEENFFTWLEAINNATPSNKTGRA